MHTPFGSLRHVGVTINHLLFFNVVLARLRGSLANDHKN